MGELQRTYRGRASRDEAEEEFPRISPERAVVVASIPRAGDEEDDRLAEIAELVKTAGASVVATVVQHRPSPDPRTFLGKGRLDDVHDLVKREKPDLVVAEAELTAGQQRQLEDRLKTRVVDRTGVILDIFALHARSAEGKLQVELAQLEYSYARQEGLWQHLERLGGGIGTRGPGETQLESDRRLLRERMGQLRRRLRDVGRSHDVMRARRVGSELPLVALAGYTNAGKSTLMNALTGAGVSVNDALFETLDPTTRAFEHDGIRFLVTDTVGFIRDLPHQLVDAFRATLQETREAHLVLHVEDASDDEGRREARRAAVEAVLDEIGAGDVPRLVVLNKVDRVDAEERRRLARGEPDAVQVSALTGEGLDGLRDRLASIARSRLTRLEALVPYADGAVISAIYAAGRDVQQEAREDGTWVRALLPAADAARIRAALSRTPGDG
ncbi:MAG: GTPase HflX [Actinomycetota bacterium]